MAVTDVRRARLEVAIDDCGGINALAARLGIPSQNIYGILSGRRNIGHKMARRIEKAMGWTEGAMDAPLLSEDAELLRLLKNLPEGDVVTALRSVISQLSPAGVAAVSQALLARVAEERE